MFIIEIVGLLAAILTTLSGVPQFLKTVRTKDTRSMSLEFLAMLTIGQALWLVYGIGLMSIPLIAANILSATVSALMFFHKIKNMKEKGEQK